MAMTLEQAEAEIEFLKVVVNQLQIAVSENLATKAQLRQLNLLRQQEISDLKDRVEDLEADIAILKQTTS